MTLFHGLGPFAASGLGGSFEFITSSTFSAASSVSIDNCFSARYDHYMLTRNCSASSAGFNISARLRAGGVDSSTGYRYQYQQSDGSTITAGRSTTATAFDALLGYPQATAFGFVVAFVSLPFAAVRTTAWSQSSSAASGSIVLLAFNYAHDTAASYDGLTLLPSGGTTITGSVAIYGVVN